MLKFGLLKLLWQEIVKLLQLLGFNNVFEENGFVGNRIKCEDGVPGE